MSSSRSYPLTGEPHGRLAAAMMAAADRSMSASVVDQLMTEMRIAAIPCQTVPDRAAKPARAVVLDVLDDLARPRIGIGVRIGPGVHRDSATSRNRGLHR